MYLILDIENALKETDLTEREAYILDKIEKGYTFTEIAEQLNIFRQSVERSFDNIIEKIERELVK